MKIKGKDKSFLFNDGFPDPTIGAISYKRDSPV